MAGIVLAVVYGRSRMREAGFLGRMAVELIDGIDAEHNLPPSTPEVLTLVMEELEVRRRGGGGGGKGGNSQVSDSRSVGTDAALVASSSRARIIHRRSTAGVPRTKMAGARLVFLAFLAGFRVVGG